MQMVCVRIINDARCKTKIWDTLISTKPSVQAEVLFTLEATMRAYSTTNSYKL